jgi:glycolate oxidase FAD binding subunit
VSAQGGRRNAPLAELAPAMRACVGGDAVAADVPARGAFAIAGIEPDLVVRPGCNDEVAACVRDTAARGGALVPLGLGVHRELGHPPLRYDVALSTTRLTRVSDYTPADMTVSVESGMTFSALQEMLAAEGQWLPIDPPLPALTTVGGLVAADLAGTLRASQGRVRDHVIGIGVVTAEGRAARAGGRVVKNVAGYDLMKLFTGSLGTLAVVTEVTFKVRPRPVVTRVLSLACGDAAGALLLAERLVEGGLAPMSATVVLDHEASGCGPALLCLLGGVAEDVAAERERLLALTLGTGAEIALDAVGEEPAGRARTDLVRDFIRAARGDVVVRAATLPRRAGALAAAMRGAIPGVPSGCLLDPCSGAVALAVESADPAPTIDALRSVTIAHGARLVVERWPPGLADTIEVWSPLPPALPLMRRMKAALDPRGTLAPGRFVGRL